MKHKFKLIKYLYSYADVLADLVYNLNEYYILILKKGKFVCWNKEYGKGSLKDFSDIYLKIALFLNSFFILCLILIISWLFLKTLIFIFRFIFNIFKIFFYFLYSNKKLLKFVENKKLILINGGLGSPKETLLFFLYKIIGRNNPFFFIGLSKNNELFDIESKKIIPYKNFLSRYYNGYWNGRKKTSFIYEVQDDIDNDKFSKLQTNFIIAELYAKKSQLFFSSLLNGKYWWEIERFSDAVINITNFKKIFFGIFLIISFEIRTAGSSYSKNQKIILLSNIETKINKAFGKI